MKDRTNDFDDTPARIAALEIILAQLMAALVNDGTLTRDDIIRPVDRVREKLRKREWPADEMDPADTDIADAIDTIMHMFDDLPAP